MNVYVSNQSRLKNWSEYSEERLEKVQKEINKESKDFILNINETEYEQYLYDKYKLIPLWLDEDSAVVHVPRKEKREYNEQDRCERTPYYWVCSIGCQVEGTIALWGVKATIYGFGGRPDFSVSGNTLTFVFNIQSENPDQFNGKKNETLQYFRNNIKFINNDVSAFNAALQQNIKFLFNKLKSDYLKENSFFAAINVAPNPDAPITYSTPIIEKRPTIQKPTANTRAFTSEPTIDDKAYRDIIDCLIRVGLSIERKPSLYVNKDEEALRDLFLTQLELAFEGGTATGETFNRSGKTDILLKNSDGTNLFVGECKVWKGLKHYNEAISQLLDYLTWDDSKTALIVFVKDVSLSSVIQIVNQATLKHPLAVRLVDSHKERFLHFMFTLPQDNQKHVAVQILLFNYDKIAEGRSKVATR